MKPKTPNNKQATQEKPSSLKGPILVAVSLMALTGIVWGAIWYTTPAVQQDPPEPSRLAALVATLAPEMFTGKAREAYQVAKEIPEVLVHMPCFCGCPRLGHKNNLYCFRDEHGQDCDMCMDIAIEAKEMHSKGTPIPEIEKYIRTKHGPESRASNDSH